MPGRSRERSCSPKGGRHRRGQRPEGRRRQPGISANLKGSFSSLFPSPVHSRHFQEEQYSILTILDVLLGTLAFLVCLGRISRVVFIPKPGRGAEAKDKH